MRTPALALTITALAALAAPELARAHELTHEVIYGRAVAVRVRYAGAEVLDDAHYQVFSPVDSTTPWQEGRTDRDGWLAFVPASPGTWRVQVADEGGHGITLSVSAQPIDRQEQVEGTLVWIVRLAAAVLAVGLVFGGLAWIHRHRKAAG
jgi:nickel transport protein